MRAVIFALVCVGAVGSAARADTSKLTIGIYAPSAELGTPQAKLAYVQSLAKAVESATGIPTEGQTFASLSALNASKVDFAIEDGICFASSPSGTLVASATIGGATARPWALFSSGSADFSSLKGKKLAFVQTGCSDAAFVDNAMLDSEVDPAFFGSRVGKADLAAAIAEVASYKNADAVFAPASAGKGLTKVFDTGSAPAPALVQRGKLPADVAEKAIGAITGTSGPLGWTKPSKEVYSGFGARLGRAVKPGVFAPPEAVRLDAKDVLIDPATLKESASVDVKHHVVHGKLSR